MSHTPGPWTFKRDTDRIMSGSGRLCVALVTSGFDDDPIDPIAKGPIYEANAHLIAAAPALLAFVRDIAERSTDAADTDAQVAEIHAAQRLVANAEGR